MDGGYINEGKNITVEGLKYIQKHHIDKLFEGFDNFNTRIIFEHRLGMWQNANGISNLSSQTTITNESIASWIYENSPTCSQSSNSNASENDTVVFDLLNKTEQGKALIINYKKSQCLRPEDRTNIVRKIIHHYTENNKTLSVKGCAKLAEQIVNIFPSEQKATYFVAGVHRAPPKGKLYDRYRGQRRAIKKLNVDECTFDSKKNKLSDVVEEDINKDSLSEVELLSICNQLKHNRNWEIVLKQWIETVRLRRDMIDKNNDPSLQQIFLDWPLFKYSKAQELIEIDYNFMKPGKTFKFEKWEIFCRHALDLYSERIKTTFLKSYLHDFREKLNMLDSAITSNTSNSDKPQLHSSSSSSSKGIFSLKKLDDWFHIELFSKDSSGGQLKTKNGQKYVLNGKPERMTRSFAILSGCVMLLAILIAILITYFITASAYGSKGCTNGHSTSNYNNHGENFSATIASASTFGMPSSRSPGSIAAAAEGHDPNSNESNKKQNDEGLNPIDRKLHMYEGWTPEIYRLSIEPNLVLSRSNGTVAIVIARDYSVRGLQPIVVDVNNITIIDARVVRIHPDTNDLEFESDYGDNNTTFVIKVQNDVESEKNLKLVVYLDFISEITNTLQGIYKTSYINSVTLETEWMISTQFSPIDARRGFPCFDRPDKKANFSISITHDPSKTTALSNMPSKGISRDRPGYVKEDFETTPKMPTYLVAFVLSNLVKANYSVSDKNAKTKIEFYTRSEGIDMTNFAYDFTRRILPFFESYFGIDYKLPKIDMVSVPDFGFGAMENWGLITFRDSSLLVPRDQEKTSSAEHTESVATIIAHELAHQWFGNLVTPKWWDDLWLKEGFATYMSYIAANSMHPEWKIMDSFTVFEFQQSMDKDSDNSSHPITFDVASTNDIRRIFDPISYSKSTILLRMLNSIVGPDAFRDATREFLKAFQYKNANRNDLWSFMTFHGHAKRTLSLDIHIKDIMNSWIQQAGYPVVTVMRNETNLVITQQRYMLPQKNNTDGTRWYIPLTFETDESKKGDDIPTHWMTTDDKEIVIEDVFSDANSSEIVVYMNLNRQGYYRVNYDYASWIVLKKKFGTLPSITRAQLLDDSFHLAQAEYLTYDIPLTFLLEMYSAIEDELLWASSQQGLNYIIFMLHREPAYETFRAFMRFIVRPAFDHYGLNEPEDATHAQLMHRARVARMACKFNYDRCTTAAQLKYREWMTNKENLINPNLKEIIYCTTLAEGSYQEWYFAYKQYKHTTSASEKEQILIALGCTQKPWLLSKFLNFTIDPSSGILKQDGARAFSAVAQNPIGFEIALDFLITNIKEISEYFGDGFSTLTKMIDSITSFMNKDYHREQLERFAIRARKLGLLSVENTIQLAMEQVNNNIYWRNRSYYNLKGFLEAIVSEFRINIF